MGKKFAGLLMLALLSIVPLANAGTITINWGEQNGPENGPLPYTLDAGTQNFTIPAGQQIISAVFDSTYGNSTVSSTAVMDVDVNGIQVGSCPDTQAPCWTNGGSPIPFSFNFPAADLSVFAGDMADLTVTQTGCCVIRLGASTLTLTTAPVTVPEPSALVLLGTGLLGGVGVVRRKLIG